MNISLRGELCVILYYQTTRYEPTLTFSALCPQSGAVAAPVCRAAGSGDFHSRHRASDVSRREGLGQKNNVVGIWLMLHFLNPVCVIAPCAYMVWQNIINAVQLWYKEKYGYLKW